MIPPNHSSLIVATFHDDKTLITFENTTGHTQHISKGAKVAILDMRSKDGGMTNFKWDIPTDNEGNLVLYAHTFASTLEPMKLAAVLTLGLIKQKRRD